MKSKLYILLFFSLISFFHSYGQERVDEKRTQLKIHMDAQSEKLTNISGWSRFENKEEKFWEQSDQTSNKSYLPCCPDAGFESLQLFKFTLESKIFYFLNVKYDSTRMRVFAFTNNSLEQLKKIINAADGLSYKALLIEDCEYYTKVFEVPFSFDPEEVIKNKEMIRLLLLGEGSGYTSNSCKGESFFNINSQILKGEKIARFNILPWAINNSTTLPLTNNYFELKKNDFDKLFNFSAYRAIVNRIPVSVDNKTYKGNSENRAVNPYGYSVVKYKSVDSTKVHYKETKNIRLNTKKPKGLAYANKKLYIISDSLLQVITVDGKEVIKTKLPALPSCITVTEKNIFIGFIDYIAKYELTGKLINSWKPLDKKTILTSIAVKDDLLFAADAGNRRVVRYSVNGEYLNSFDGKSSKDDQHGFIVPSPCFDLAFNGDGKLWVANPGKLALEQYLDNGTFRSFWAKDEDGIEGFWGCCNPAHMAFLPDGSFVTSENNSVRIKVYKPSGEFDSVVAPSEKFPNEEVAPYLAVTSEGDIYALDFDKKVIRLFQHK